jgi:uncharacterized protein YdeI (YjbR/CyaY-like superfamily)
MEVNKMNPKVDLYIADGCGRCKYYATEKCKVRNWQEALETLRQIVLESGLVEEIKWGVPVYTHKGKNVLTVAALKAYCAIGFFKGVLLADTQKILSQQGNLQSDRLVKFTSVKDILALEHTLKSYINEAITIEDSGRRVVYKKNPEPMPEELLYALENDALLKKAFYALTLGRQRGYIIYFSQPKQTQTRVSRIKKYMEQILKGKGLND